MKYQCIQCGKLFGKRWAMVQEHFATTGHCGTQDTCIITYKCPQCPREYLKWNHHARRMNYKESLERHFLESGHLGLKDQCFTSNYLRMCNGHAIESFNGENSDSDGNGDDDNNNVSTRANTTDQTDVASEPALAQNRKICDVTSDFSLNRHLVSKNHSTAAAEFTVAKSHRSRGAIPSASGGGRRGKTERVARRPLVEVSTTPAELGSQTYGLFLQPDSSSDDDEESDDNSHSDSTEDDISSRVTKSTEDVVSDLFFPKEAIVQCVRHDRNGIVIGDIDSSSDFHDAAYFGRLVNSNDSSVGSQCVYLNTHEPFCFATVGTQGAGKSHTLACVIESCLIPMPIPAGREIVRLNNPMAALVLHYEQNESSICEATGLISPLRSLERTLLASSSPVLPALPREKMIVLVSPSYYRQRKAFYGDYCIVKPLLFKWASLSADHIKKIMRINENDTQLYVAAMLDLLRKYQRDCVVPDFKGFLSQISSICNSPGQISPLRQRTALLESLVAESQLNTGIAAEGADIASCLCPGVLVIADLTDPLLSSEEANGIFQVLTEKFRTAHIPQGCGKLLALDEAHKFMRGDKSDGLSNSIVTAVRLMRHDGMRVAISTQSPLTLAPELLELVSMAVLHRFHSSDWFTYLKAKIPLDDKSLEEILNLTPGTGLVFASRHQIAASEGRNLMKIAVRPRLTADRGASRKNAQFYGGGNL